VAKDSKVHNSWLEVIKKNYRLLLMLLLVTVAVLIVYGNDFAILANEAWLSESFSHVLLLPFFAGFLIYLKKDALKASLSIDTPKNKQFGLKYVNELAGLILLIISFLVYWYGSYTFYPLQIHVLSLPIFLMGLTLIILNSQAFLKLIFPFLFLLFLVPLPTTILSVVGGYLANFNTQASFSLLSAAGLPMTLSGDYGAPTVMMTTAAGQAVNFTVDIPCSGIYSLTAFAMFAAFLAFISYTKIWKKISVFILGFLVFTLLNMLRIMAIFAFGYWFGEEVAMTIHSFAGIALIFIGMIIILVLSDKVLKIKIMTKTLKQRPCPECSQKKIGTGFCQNCGRFLNKTTKAFYSKTLFAKLLLIILLCGVVFMSITAPTFATANGSGDLTFLTGENYKNANSTLPEISGYTLQFLYRDTAYEKLAKQDASLIYGYFPENRSSSIIYADIGVSSSLSNLHNWEVCLVTYQTAQGENALVTVHDSREILLLENPPLVAQYFVFDSPNNYTQVTLYWYEKASFNTGLTVEQKYVRISLVILTQDASKYPELEQELYAMGLIIAESWEPLKTQALISLGIPAQQSLLVGSTLLLVGTWTTQYFAEKRKSSNNRNIFSQFSSKKEQIVFASVSELTKTKKHMRTTDIVEAVAKRVGKPVSSKTVYRVLKALEEAGLVKRTIISVGNSPVMVWKL
jgi:exosortase